MKKFFTDLSKYRSAIIVAVTVLTYAFSAYAEEYKSMIRYDRVWECYCILDGKDNDTYKCMRFDGTEDINGSTYHRLVTFKKRTNTYDPETGLYTYQIEDCLEHEGYLREEDGKVFTLIKETVPENSYGADSWGMDIGWLHIPETDCPDSHDECKEHLLYDMSWEEGGCYDAISFVTGNAISNRFSVLNVSYVEIDGEECKMMYVCNEDTFEYHKTYETPYYWYPSIIEGIGAVDKGCLNYHEFIDWPTGLYSHNYFTCLYDLDGNVIYCVDTDHFGYDYGSFSSVNNISAETEAKADAIYDILGRRIGQPAPGQLYIQSGKKHIAK